MSDTHKNEAHKMADHIAINYELEQQNEMVKIIFNDLINKRAERAEQLAEESGRLKESITRILERNQQPATSNQ